MVRGIEIFTDHFLSYADHYVLIGGTVVSMALERAGLQTRKTKDLDIVLCVEALNNDFANVFWEFIRKGGYNNQQKSTGKKLFYRFNDPQNLLYPEILELFSRVPDALSIQDESHLTPIPVSEEVSSLSAILLDKDYYDFIHSGKTLIDGLAVVKPEYIIPLKAKAWIDMTERRNSGQDADEKDIRKHKNDIFRLYQIIDPETDIKLPPSIYKDLSLFWEKMKVDGSVDLKALGIKRSNTKDIIKQMEKMYGVEH